MERHALTSTVLLLGTLCILLSGCTESDAESAMINSVSEKPSSQFGSYMAALDEQAVELLLSMSPIPPVPVDDSNKHCDDHRAEQLGRMVFFEQRLSENGRIACSTCHDPDHGFSSGEALAIGLRRTTRNAPTILNTGFGRWFSWDGGSDALWAQSLKPFEDEAEHGYSRDEMLEFFNRNDGYRKMYEDIFGTLPQTGDVSRVELDRFFVNVGKALAAFQRRLTSTVSRFDIFVEQLRSGRNDATGALTPDEVAGMRIFFGKGSCTLCHSGPLFTDMEFHNIRVPARDLGDEVDAGRYSGVGKFYEAEFNRTCEFSDCSESTPELSIRVTGQLWGQFKTPSLRDVEHTAPYMHNGVFQSLDEVVHHYSTFENAIPAGHHEETVLKPLELSSTEQQSLVAFLKTLSSIKDPSVVRQHE